MSVPRVYLGLRQRGKAHFAFVVKENLKIILKIISKNIFRFRLKYPFVFGIMRHNLKGREKE